MKQTFKKINKTLQFDEKKEQEKGGKREIYEFDEKIYTI